MLAWCWLYRGLRAEGWGLNEVWCLNEVWGLTAEVWIISLLTSAFLLQPSTQHHQVFYTLRLEFWPVLHSRRADWYIAYRQGSGCDEGVLSSKGSHELLSMRYNSSSESPGDWWRWSLRRCLNHSVTKCQALFLYFIRNLWHISFCLLLHTSAFLLLTSAFSLPPSALFRWFRCWSFI